MNYRMSVMKDLNISTDINRVQVIHAMTNYIQNKTITIEEKLTK